MCRYAFVWINTFMHMLRPYIDGIMASMIAMIVQSR